MNKTKINIIKKTLIATMIMGVIITFLLSCDGDIDTVEKGSASLYIRSFGNSNFNILLSGKNLEIISSKKVHRWGDSETVDFGTSPEITNFNDEEYVIVEFEWSEDIARESSGLNSFFSDARSVPVNDLELTLTISVPETGNEPAIEDDIVLEIKDKSGIGVHENRYSISVAWVNWEKEIQFSELVF